MLWGGTYSLASGRNRKHSLLFQAATSPLGGWKESYTHTEPLGPD